MRAFLIGGLLVVPVLVTCGEAVTIDPLTDSPAATDLAASGRGFTRLRHRPTPDGPAYRSGLISNIAVVYQNGNEHAENVELHLLPSKETLLAFRAGGTGQAERFGSLRITFDPRYAGGPCPACPELKESSRRRARIAKCDLPRDLGRLRSLVSGCSPPR